MTRIHVIVTALSAIILLLSINRLTSLPSMILLQPHDFLRLVDFNAMLVIPLFSIVLYYLLKREISSDATFRKKNLYIALNILFITGVYLFGASSGVHEVTNYLNTRFCDRGELQSSLCNIISFNDDTFSHYVYYLGFILLNVSLMTFEYFQPRRYPVKKRDLIYITCNGLIIALGIFANLAFEETTLDLFFFGSIMLFSLYLSFFAGKSIKQLPVVWYFTVSYTVGVISTLIYKFLA